MGACQSEPAAEAEHRATTTTGPRHSRGSPTAKTSRADEAAASNTAAGTSNPLLGFSTVPSVTAGGGVSMSGTPPPPSSPLAADLMVSISVADPSPAPAGAHQFPPTAEPMKRSSSSYLPTKTPPRRASKTKTTLPRPTLLTALGEPAMEADQLALPIVAVQDAADRSCELVAPLLQQLHHSQPAEAARSMSAAADGVSTAAATLGLGVSRGGLGGTSYLSTAPLTANASFTSSSHTVPHPQTPVTPLTEDNVAAHVEYENQRLTDEYKSGAPITGGNPRTWEERMELWIDDMIEQNTVHFP